MKTLLCNCFLLGSRPKGSTTGTGSWFQTLPEIGEYPDKNITVNGKAVDGVIVVDQAAIDKCMSAFKVRAADPNFRGLLVDREHFSLMADHTSDAMAWATDIRTGAEGIWTLWEFTPDGQRIWDNKILLSRSPVMELEHIGTNRYRPVAILSIAMTNTPQFETLSTFAAARAAETQTPKGTTTMTKLLALLGLAETATEDEAIVAVQALIDSQAAAETAIEEAQAEVIARRCDAFIAANKGSISDVDKFKTNYIAAPDAIEAAFGYYRAAPGQKPRINARDASTPAHAPGSGKPRAQIAAKRQSAVSTYRAGNPSCSFAAAWAACRSADPDLFADE
ncbi:MAG: phage protease [Kiritimatiellae bacterium]|nr:phage protease [Kiritimatiellia bacterium]